MNKDLKIGLALSGGGARGISHLGMMKALEEAGIRFAALSATSSGAIIGGLYCKGYTPDEILRIIQGINFLTTLRPSFNKRSFLKLEAAANELRKYLSEDDFSALKTPLFVFATDIENGTIERYDQGPLIYPILASCSIPVIFEPVKFKGKTLVDGGILDNLPHQPLEQMTDKLIGMHCNPVLGGFKATGWKSMMERSMMMVVTQNVYAKKHQFDVFLEPPEVGAYKVFDFRKAKELFQIGYDYARKSIGEGVLDKLQ